MCTALITAMPQQQHQHRQYFQSRLLLPLTIFFHFIYYYLNAPHLAVYVHSINTYAIDAFHVRCKVNQLLNPF